MRSVEIGTVGSFSLKNVVIAGNTAGMQAGGLSVGATNVQASNIIISGNMAGDAFFKDLAFEGGGVYAAGSILTIANGTITGNRVLGKTSVSGEFGGAIFTDCQRFPGDPDHCTIHINNSILYGNSAQYGSEIFNASKNFFVQNSLVQGSGGSSAWKAHAVDAGGNIDADPQFILPVDPASAPTIAGDLRQQLASPVVNTGNNTLVLQQPVTGTTDFAGNPRVFDAIVDMGPYEVSIKCPAAGTTRLYVNALANGGNLGTSWATALTKVQDALALVDNCPGNTISEIWVAQGTYYPDEGYYPTANDRAAAFQLPNGVALYGGFLGSETDLSQRNSWAHISTLSGDIGQDDHTDANQLVETPADIVAPNSYHVVVASGTNNSARLDGFAITAGQANGSAVAKQHEGGGLFAESGSPTLNNLALVGNVAVEGGAMTLLAGSNPLLSNAWFGGNGATDYGGALHNESSNPTLTNVLFSGNRAMAGGGAIYNLASNPTLINVTIASQCGRRHRECSGSGGGALWRRHLQLHQQQAVAAQHDHLEQPGQQRHRHAVGLHAQHGWRQHAQRRLLRHPGAGQHSRLALRRHQHRPESPLPRAAQPDHGAQLRRRPAPADRVARHRRGQQQLQQPARATWPAASRALPTATATASPSSIWAPTKRRCCWRRASSWPSAPARTRPISATSSPSPTL